MAKRGRPRYPDILTPREWDVLALLRDGLSNQQIAERLAITERTAKYHVAEIVGKLGVRGREEAAQWRPEEAPGWALLGVPFVFMWKKATLAGLAAAGAGATFVGVASVAALVTWGAIRTTEGADTDMANFSSPSVLETATPSSEADQDSGFALEGVDLADLEGITLSAVEPGFQPKVSKREAELLATQSPGLSATVQGSLLAYVSGLGHDREAWIISLEGTLAPPGPPGGVVKYLVAFVDARTGQWYTTISAAGPPPGGWPSHPVSLYEWASVGLLPAPLSAPGELP